MVAKIKFARLSRGPRRSIEGRLCQFGMAGPATAAPTGPEMTLSATAPVAALLPTVWPQAVAASAGIVTERVVTARLMTKSSQQRALNAPLRCQFRSAKPCRNRLSGHCRNNSRDSFKSVDINQTPSPCHTHESKYSNRVMHWSLVQDIRAHRSVDYNADRPRCCGTPDSCESTTLVPQTAGLRRVLDSWPLRWPSN